MFDIFTKLLSGSYKHGPPMANVQTEKNKTTTNTQGIYTLRIRNKPTVLDI